jgi:hypothetical protein
MITNGDKVVIIDFGLADDLWIKKVDGTPGFAFKGKQPFNGFVADVYSLSITFRLML